jgi:hypothetical protein
MFSSSTTNYQDNGHLFKYAASSNLHSVQLLTQTNSYSAVTQTDRHCVYITAISAVTQTDRHCVYVTAISAVNQNNKQIRNDLEPSDVLSSSKQYFKIQLALTPSTEQADQLLLCRETATVVFLRNTASGNTAICCTAHGQLQFAEFSQSQSQSTGK